MITRPRVKKPEPRSTERRPWAVDYPVTDGRTFTAYGFLSWRDAMKFAGFVASTSKAKT